MNAKKKADDRDVRQEVLYSSVSRNGRVARWSQYPNPELRPTYDVRWPPRVSINERDFHLFTFLAQQYNATSLL